MFEYAQVTAGVIVDYRMFPTPLDLATVKREGGSLAVVHPDATQTAIAEADVGRVIAAYRIVVVDGVIRLDGVVVAELPPGTLIGSVIRVGGLPMMRPVREIKPAFNPLTQVLVNQNTAIADDEVVRTYAVAPRSWKVPKALMVERLIAAGKGAAVVTAINADPVRRLRWETIGDIPHDHAMMLALLAAAGADPAVILAPPEV